ncbi:MAG: GumC family protein [Chthoniobacterales bacterium]
MTNPAPSSVAPLQRAPATAAPMFSTTTGASIDPAGERRGFDFRHFWHSLIEKIWIVALCVVAGLFLGLGYLAKTPKLYRGHTVLEVDVQEPSPVTTEDSSARMRSAFLASQEAMRTIEQNLVNRTLLARVIRSEGLAEDGGRALLGTTPDSSAKASATPAKPSANVTTGRVETTYTPLEEALGGALSTMVKPVIRRGTRLIDLFVTHHDPVLAQRLTEAVGREYIRSAIERRAGSNQETLRYLLEEEERLKTNLQKSEAAVAEYKANTPDALQLGGGTTSTGSQPGAGAGTSRGGLVEDRLQELTTKVTTAKTERLRLESEIKQIEQLGDNVDALLAIPSIAAAPAVTERRRDVAQMETAVAALTQRYKEKHPKMMAARAGLAEAKDALKRTVIAQPALLQSMLEQARASEATLTAATQEQEKAAVALNKAAIGYHELARQAETDRALYESVLRQIKETNLTKDVKTNAVAVIEHSPLPSTPVSPSASKALALGLLGGLALGLAFVYASDALDRSIKTVDQAEAHFGLPVLAAVPEVKKDEVGKTPVGTAPGSESYRLVAEAPEGPAAEAFRNLRASLSLLGPEAERKVFLFTSALPSEGKSFTSANYALALAQQGFRVLLIDGDLRRPSLHKIFVPSDGGNGAKEDPPGIVDYLVGETQLAAAARPVSAGAFDIASANGEEAGILTATGGKLSVLTGGRRAPNPAELLSGPSFGKLIAEAARTFDRVVIDSAPILAVSDTLLMTPLVQTVCVVVRASHTPRHAVQRALGMLTGAGGRPAGVVLNRLPRNRGAGYYYYYASHGYGKGEGAYSGKSYGTKGSDRAS